jgi:competence protein ComEC
MTPALLLPLALLAAEPRGLDIYFVDVEGGAATLIVTPAREAILIDCGNPGPRDAGRIHAVARAAGLDAIDTLILTHWHADHYGGVPRLAELLPVRRYLHHGVPESLAEDRQFPLLMAGFKKAAAGKDQVLKPGDAVPLKQAGGPAVALDCLCGSGEVVADKPGAPANPVAAGHKPQADDPTDNAKSLGFVLRFGDWRFLDLGDLTWNVEAKLVGPSDKVGPVDVYQSTHHGLPVSNNPVVIDTVRPRVAVFNNGAKKGGHPQVLAALRRSPEIQAIWQMHRNVTVGAQENTDPAMIANPDEQCRGEYLVLRVAPDAKSYTLAVGANGRPTRYETRPAGK